MTETLITTYRPQKFDYFVGNKAAVTALRRVVNEAENPPRGYIFTGPSGIGKTTLARVVARVFDAEIIEIDAATHSGVDAMREIIEQANYLGMSGTGNKMIVIDECHALSKQAFQAVLKTLEEPPEHLYFAFCTTQDYSIPDTVQTRCFSTVLRPITSAQMKQYLTEIARHQGWTVDSTVLNHIVEASTGQLRKGLTILEKAHAATVQEISELLSSVSEDHPAMLELGRALLKPKQSWATIRPLLNNLSDGEYDNAMSWLGRYVVGAMSKTNDENEIRFWNAILYSTIRASGIIDKKVAFTAAVASIVINHSRFWEE